MFTSLSNFRPIGGHLYSDTSHELNHNTLKLRAYRTSRPDNISEEDFEKLQSELGIRFVVDLRLFLVEYPHQHGSKIMDYDGGNSSLKVVDVRKMEQKKTEDIIWYEKDEKLKTTTPPFNGFKHYMVGLNSHRFHMEFFKNSQIPFCKRALVASLFLLYLLFGLETYGYFLAKELENQGLFNLYSTIIDSCGVGFRTALRIINRREGQSFIVCCRHGKDRTGILSAIILSLCGFDREVILNDFTLTEVGLPPDHDEFQGVDEEFRKAPREPMSQLLQYVDDKYGSVSQYLQSLGFSLEEQAKLKANVMELKS